MPRIDEIPDLRGTICLWCESGEGFPEIEERLKKELSLVNRSENADMLARILSSPHPEYPSHKTLYTVIMKPGHSRGPVVNLSYASKEPDLTEPYLDEDPRRSAVEIIAEGARLKGICDLEGRKLNLSYLENPMSDDFLIL